jgi:hypothetical protein
VHNLTFSAAAAAASDDALELEPEPEPTKQTLCNTSSSSSSSSSTDDATVPMQVPVPAVMSSAMTNRYFHDFVCMHVVSNDNTQVALTHVKRITRAFLQTAFGEKPWLHVSDIHVCYWAVAPYFQAVLRVVNALPQYS